MGLLGDFNEVKELWGKSSIWGKFLAILAFFTTTSSIASLSDIVFKWRGLFLDGIEFYNTHISLPISEFFSFLNINLTVAESDALIISLIFIGSILRVDILEAYRSREITKFFINGGFLSLLLLFPLSGSFREDYSDYGISTAIIGVVMVWLILIYTHYSNYRQWKRIPSRIHLADRDKGRLLMLTVPVLISVILVLILAAINKGLYMS